LNHYACTPDLAGGTRHFDLASELTRLGHDVTIIASAFHQPHTSKRALLNGKPWALEEVDGVKCIWLPSFSHGGSQWRRLAGMLNYAWRAYLEGRRLSVLEPDVQRPDVVIGSSVHLFSVLAAYHLSRFHRARFVMEVRDLWPQSMLDAGVWQEGQPQVHIFRWLEQFLFSRAEMIVALSPLTQGYLARYSAEWADKVVYVPNGTRVARFERHEQGEERREGPLQVMYLGSMGPSNGLDLLIRAMRIVERASPGLMECVLVGGGREKPRLRQMVADFGLQTVRFENSVPRAQVPACAAVADIFVLVQREVLYGSSNKLYDYMAAGKPIVTAVFAEHNDPVSSVGCGLSALPTSAEDLAEKLLTVAALSQEERRAMGERARAYARRHHDYSVLARDLANALDRLGSPEEVSGGS